MRWNNLVLEEFYAQGDREQRLGFESSSLMDRHEKHRLSANQVGFINLIAKPLLEGALSVFSGLEPIVNELEKNLLFWSTYQEPCAEVIVQVNPDAV
jgi:hypothetical protein